MASLPRAAGAELRQVIRAFAKDTLRPIAERVDSVDEFSPEVITILRKAGLFKYLTPVEYGGYGICSANACIIREELARVCTQADVTFVMSLFASHGITEFGTTDQKARYLPALARGESLGTAAITEPGAGSDLYMIATTARPKDGGYGLNGTKTFITMAAAADACIVIARTSAETDEKPRFSAFIVDCTTDAPSLRKRVLKLMSPHPVYELEFVDHFVEASQMLGKEGDGLTVAMSMLGRARTTVAAAAIGMAKSAYEETAAYVRKRVAFRRELWRFQATQMKLADMLVDIEAACLLTEKAARIRDEEDSERSMKYASMAKLFATEAAQRVIDEALQMHGGLGVVRGTRVEYLYRTIRALRVYEGTSEIQRLTIARDFPDTLD